MLVNRSRGSVPSNDTRSLVTAFHEAGHAVAVLALGFRLDYAEVLTHREGWAKAVQREDGYWCVFGGGVKADGVMPHEVMPGAHSAADMEPGPELDSMRQQAFKAAVIALAGPVAQARYRKVALNMVLRSTGPGGDMEQCAELQGAWFADQPGTLVSTALPKAREVVSGARWRAVERIAHMLMQYGRVTGAQADAVYRQVVAALA